VRSAMAGRVARYAVNPFPGGIPDRVAPGGCPPGAPTDPNVRN
jgi:hypothetical protein